MLRLLLLFTLIEAASLCKRSYMMSSGDDGTRSPVVKIPSSPPDRDFVPSPLEPGKPYIGTSPESDSTFRLESSPFCPSPNLGFSPFGKNLSGELGTRLLKKRKLSFGNDPMEQDGGCSKPGSSDLVLPRDNFQESRGHPQWGFNIDQDMGLDELQNPQLHLECSDDSSSTTSMNIASDSESVSDAESESSGLISDINLFNRDVLYENSSVTVEEAVVDLCDVYVKNRMSKTALGDTLKFLHKILPAVNGMPRNLRELFKFINYRASPVEEIAHVYCPECFTVKAAKDDQCRTEGCTVKGGNCFYEFPLEQKLIYLFDNGGLAEAVEDFHQSRVTEVDIISDICDGSEVKNLKEKYSGPYDLTLLWNTDGIALDTEFRLWPLLFTVCEIPVQLRAFFIWVALIWHDMKEPPMKTFLKPFVESLVKIHDQRGITWTHPKSGKTITSQVLAPAAVADAPARSKLQETKQYNGINGCNTCEFTCISIMVDGKKRYFYVYNENPATLCTCERMIAQARMALTAPKGSVMGVKGISPVYPVPHLDIAKFVFPEYMHSVLLGCVVFYATYDEHERGMAFKEKPQRS